MATYRLSFGALLSPDASGSVYWQPSGILDTNDLAPTDQVLIFADTATLLKSFAHLQVPKNFVGTAKVFLRLKCTATSGDVLMTLDYRSIAVAETGDPATWQESLAGTATAIPATTNLFFDISFTLTSSNLAVDDTVLISVNRNCAGADTVAASIQLYDAIFEYADA